MFENTLTSDASGTLATAAGSHPYAMTTNIELKHYEVLKEGSQQPFPEGGDLKSIEVNLPAGLIVNPDATPQKCSEAELEAIGGRECPSDSAVGVVHVYVSSFSRFGLYAPVYNMMPPPGAPGALGFNLVGLGFISHIVGGVRVGSDYGVSATLAPTTQKFGVTASTLTLWGDPSSASHDAQRGKCGGFEPEEKEEEEASYREEVEGGRVFTPEEIEKEYNFWCPGPPNFTSGPFLTMPTSCGEQTTSIRAASWLMEPGEWTSPLSSSPAMPPVTGCESLDFSPSLTVRPESSSVSAESPTGLEVDLKIPQEESVEGLAESDLKEALVTLPAGMTVSPSAANGLGACSEAQIGLDNANSPSCPDSSKLGSVEIDTPLLEAPLKGSVFLAQQGNLAGNGSNPFGSLFALYLVAEGSGVLVKLPGEVRLDPATGQVSAKFGKDPTTGFYLPQLPFSELRMHFFGGHDAPLMTPSSCGTYATTSQLTPWDGNSAAKPSSEFAVAQGCGTGRFAPSFSAGTTNPQAAGYSPFSLTFSRNDGEQRLGGVQVTMPPGLLGRIAGVTQCPEPQAGRGECGEGSLLGEASTAVGAGPDPYWVKGGKVYLTGPYNNGPFGLSIVVPTTAGPFTLTGNGGPGREIVRASIRVNPNTAQITVLSDPLPTILEGVPLDIRTVNVTVNRSGFMFNPTNCAASSVTGAIASTSGARAGVSSPFEAANCAALPFKPVLTASTSGRTSKANGASLKVDLASAGIGQANIAKLDLTIPKILPARLTTLQKACTEAQFNANPAGCSGPSDIGTAVVHTPVLNNPLIGPAYFVSHGGAAFPDVEIVLQGEGVTIVLDGKTQIKNGVTYSRFETTPDAPFTSFEFNAPEGPYSIFTANRNLCAQSLAMPTIITGQNGAQIKQSTAIEVTGCSGALAISAHRIKKRRLRLTLYVPAAGKVTVGGRGLTHKTKTAKGRGTLTFTLKQKKAGKLKTTVKVAFTPTKGKKQTKSLSVKFKR